MMNPLYNNRIYYCNIPGTFNMILRHVYVNGNHVGETRELANTRIVIPELNEEFKGYFAHAGAKMSQVEVLMKCIEAGDTGFISDTYDSAYYVFLKDEMKKAAAQFKDDCALTRRAVIAFPATHCFETIQLLYRDGELIVTVNMRSCNAHVNLASDLYLAFLVAREAYMIAFDKPPKKTAMIANIGSLHMFKGDKPNVL